MYHICSAQENAHTAADQVQHHHVLTRQTSIVRYAVPDAPTCSRPLLSCRGSQMSTVSSSR